MWDYLKSDSSTKHFLIILAIALLAVGGYKLERITDNTVRIVNSFMCS